MKIYVASSWRNELQNDVVLRLRNEGHDVYDFKNPPKSTGFSWCSVDENWENWTASEYMAALSHPIAQAGFDSDFNAMDEAEVCVLVLPCGRSAHTEAGYMAGQGKPVYVLTNDEQEPELMYKIYHAVTDRLEFVIEDITRYEWAETFKEAGNIEKPVEIHQVDKIIFLKMLDFDIREARRNGKRIVYIAGKVTGLDPAEVKAKFKAKKVEMEEKGWFVLNPCEYIKPTEHWQTAMRMALTLLMMSDDIAMIHDWQLSEGAKIEFAMAAKMGISVIED
jgi:hypothetical protein